MTKLNLTACLCLLLCLSLKSQTLATFADSVRKTAHIPELGYAVVSSGKVHDLQVLGIKKINSTLAAAPTDKFRIGSNTKVVTSFIAALLVKEGKIAWNTKFFDLFPELKAGSNKDNYELTLLDLLTFRTRLYSYSYYYPEPKTDQFKGNDAEQRYQFLSWFLKHETDTTKKEIHFSNLSYVAAGFMLEKVSGKDYKMLVQELGSKLGIDFRFGQPNLIDSLKQPWGHNKDMVPEAPANNVKLNWLLAAGNITVSLPDYSKFIQLQLQGRAGKSTLLSKEEFNFLFTCQPEFSAGWFSDKDAANQAYYFHDGNPGTFLSRVYLYKETDMAFILFSNAQTDDANKGLDLLFERLRKMYAK